MGTSLKIVLVEETVLWFEPKMTPDSAPLMEKFDSCHIIMFTQVVIVTGLHKAGLLILVVLPV